MRKIFVFVILSSILLYSETLFEVKDSANNKVFDVSTDGIAVMNLGDTLMVISTTEIKAVIDDSKALSRKFSVSTTSAKKGLYTDLFDVSTGSATMRESGGSRYTDFSPENIFIGLQAGLLTEPGYINFTDVGKENLFIGNYAGFSHTTGMNNIFVGSSAGYVTNYGSRNIFMGVNAGYNNKTGADNVYIGTDAGKGYQSGSIFSNGDSNVFIGVKSGYTIRTGFQNVALGYWSGYYNQAGNYNVFLGGLSGVNNVDGIENVYVGYASGAFNNGSNNVFLGKNGNLDNRSISGCVFLGNNAGSPETLSNKLYIANSNTSTPLIKGTFPNTDITITATNINLSGTLNGNINSSYTANNYLRISSTAPQNAGIELLRTGTGYYDWRIYNTGGNLKFGVSSDDLVSATDVLTITSAGNISIPSLYTTTGSGGQYVRVDSTGKLYSIAVKEENDNTSIEEIEMLKKENQEIRKELEEIRLLLKSKE